MGEERASGDRGIGIDFPKSFRVSVSLFVKWGRPYQVQIYEVSL